MRSILTSIVLSTILLSIFLAYYYPAKAESNDFYMLDSGVMVYSPLNITYYNTNVILNLSLYGAGNMGGLDPQISMNYSVDGMYNGSVHLVSDGELHVVTRAIGTANLPSIPEGSHYLTLYYYGLNQKGYDPKYSFYVNTIQFSTVGQGPLLPSSPTATANPIPQITTSPVSIPTPENPSNQPSLSSTPFVGLTNSTMNASPTIIGGSFITVNYFDFYYVILPAIILIALLSILFYRKHKLKVS